MNSLMDVPLSYVAIDALYIEKSHLGLISINEFPGDENEADARGAYSSKLSVKTDRRGGRLQPLLAHVTWCFLPFLSQNE